MVTMGIFDKLIEILFGDKYSVGMWKRSIFGCFRFRFHFVVQILVAIPFSKLEAVNRFHIPSNQNGQRKGHISKMFTIDRFIVYVCDRIDNFFCKAQQLRAAD